jgi:hypothetical protein
MHQARMLAMLLQHAGYCAFLADTATPEVLDHDDRGTALTNSLAR